MPSIGRARHSVEIEKKTVQKGPTGPTETWTLQETRKASVSLLSLQQRARYQQLDTEVTHRFDFRGSVNISFSDTRLIWKDRMYEPVAPEGDPSGVGRFTSIVVRDIGPVKA